MPSAPEEPSPRAPVLVGTYALEVGLGGVFGALAVRAATPALGEVEREVALHVIAALVVWCALLAGAVRLARAYRARLHPAVGLIIIALPALGLVGPVVLQLAFTRGADANPFSGWDGAMKMASNAVDPGSFWGAVIWAAIVPFVLVGAPLAARPRAPLWAVAVLGACGGYLGLVAMCALLAASSPVIVLGVRHGLLVGIPFAVIGMGVVMAPGPARRRWLSFVLAVGAVAPVIGCALRAHPRHLVAHLIRVQDGYTFLSVCRRIAPEFWMVPLADPRPGVRSRALDALEAHGRGAAAAAPALLFIAQHDVEIAVRVDALAALGAVVRDTPGDAAMWKAVFALVTDRSATVSGNAHAFIVRHAHPAASEALVAAILEADQRGKGEDARRDLGSPLVGWWGMHGTLMSNPDGFLRTVLLIHGGDQVGASRFLHDRLGRDTLVEVVRLGVRSRDPVARHLAARALSEMRDPSVDLTGEERRLMDAELAE